MKLKRSKPNFSFLLPKNRNINSIIRLSQEYNMIYEIYEDEYTGKEMVGLWEKVNIDN